MLELDTIWVSIYRGLGDLHWQPCAGLVLSVKILVGMRWHSRMVHPTVYFSISNRAGHERCSIKRPHSVPPPRFLFHFPTVLSSFSHPPTCFLFLLPTVIFFITPNTGTRPILKLPKRTYRQMLLKEKENSRNHSNGSPIRLESGFATVKQGKVSKPRP